VIITINAHTWKSRVAIMRERYPSGLSNANRKAAGCLRADEVEVQVELDIQARVVAEPMISPAPSMPTPPLARAYNRLAYKHKREHVLAIETAKRADTRERRIQQALETLRGAAE
jgi:hypothetical protein